VSDATTANTKKALGSLDSRATVCAPRSAAVLDVSCFVDHASPFHSSRDSLARAIKRARDYNLQTSPVAPGGATRFLTAPQPPGREHVPERT